MTRAIVAAKTDLLCLPVVVNLISAGYLIAVEDVMILSTSVLSSIIIIIIINNTLYSLYTKSHRISYVQYVPVF